MLKRKLRSEMGLLNTLQFVNVYALYPELFAEADFEVYRRVKERVKAAVVEHFGLQPDSLFLSHPTFFSRITADPAKTIHDEVS